MKRMAISTTMMLLAAGIFFSCEKEIEFRGEIIRPKIVLYSLLQPDSLIRAFISSSHPVYEMEYSFEPVVNARVLLYRDGNLPEQLTYVPAVRPPHDPEPRLSLYVSRDSRAAAGCRYRMEVAIPGYEPVSSQAVLPSPVPVISLDTSIIRHNDFGWIWSEWRTKLKFRDPPGQDNFYRLVVHYTSGTYMGDKSRPYSPGQPVVVIAYEDLWIDTDDPLLDPSGEGEIINARTGNPYSVFSDELISGKEYELAFDIIRAEETMDTSYHEFWHVDIGLWTISEDLYLFYLTADAHRQVEGNPFSEPVIVHSNVENGLGIFGACTSSKHEIRQGRYPVEGVFYLDDREYWDWQH